MEAFRSNAWVLKVTLMSVVLGALLAVSLKTQQALRRDGTPQRPGQLIEAYRSAKAANTTLRAQVTDLQRKLTTYEYQISKGTGASQTLNKELQDVKFMAGLTAVEGPGVIVTLRDSKKRVVGESIAPALEAIIHDSDIRNVVNEMRVAGAEAISVNGQRLTSTSAIRCAGSVILVNGVNVAAPYELKAIGDPKTIDGALRMPNGIADSFIAYPDMIDISQEEKIIVPAYDGNRQAKWSHPVPNEHSPE